MTFSRRSINKWLMAPAIIRTRGLLMPIRVVPQPKSQESEVAISDQSAYTVIAHRSGKCIVSPDSPFAWRVRDLISATMPAAEINRIYRGSLYDDPLPPLNINAVREALLRSGYAGPLPHAGES